jgi:hypothetical protein
MKWVWFLVLACSAGGQDLFNLRPEEAIEAAMRSHRLLASGQARVEAAHGARQQAALRPNPRLFLQTENTRLGGCLASTTFSGQRQLFFPINDN